MVNPKLDWTVGRSLPFNDRSIGDRPPDAPASPRGSEGGVLGTNRSQSEGVVPPGSPIVPSVLAGTPRTPSDRSEKRGVGRGTTATWSTTRLGGARGRRTGPLRSHPRSQVSRSTSLFFFVGTCQTQEAIPTHAATRTAHPGKDRHHSRHLPNYSCATWRSSRTSQHSPSQMTCRGEDRTFDSAVRFLDLVSRRKGQVS